MTTLTETIRTETEAHEDALQYRKTKLAEMAAKHEQHDAISLANAVNAVAEAEGALRAFQQLLSAAEWAEQDETETVEAVVTGAIVSILTAPSEDTMSGRTGDVRRARQDGAREAIRDIKYKLRLS